MFGPLTPRGEFQNLQFQSIVPYGVDMSQNRVTKKMDDFWMLTSSFGKAVISLPESLFGLFFPC